MQTIETQVEIGGNHKLTIQIPKSVSEGDYEVVLVLNNVAEPQDKTSATRRGRSDKGFYCLS